MKLTVFILLLGAGLVVVPLEAAAQLSGLVGIPFYDDCETSGSYTAEWMKQSRYKAESLESRRKAAAAMTREQRERISDGDSFPSMFQTCGMGFYEGLAKVRKDGKVGFIDRSGRVIIPLKFSDATRFSEGLAGVELVDGKWGFIDTTGNLVLKAAYDWALRFNEGRALVKIGEKWGFIDKAGNLVVQAKYGKAWPFSEGLAAVQVQGLEPISKIEDHWMTGYVDLSGNLVIDHKYGGSGFFIAGKAMVYMSVNFADRPGYYTACFWIDKSGKIISEELDSCNEGNGMTSTRSDVEVIFDNDYRTGYRLPSGKILWEPSK